MRNLFDVITCANSALQVPPTALHPEALVANLVALQRALEAPWDSGKGESGKDGGGGSRVASGLARAMAEAEAAARLLPLPEVPRRSRRPADPSRDPTAASAAAASAAAAAAAAPPPLQRSRSHDDDRNRDDDEWEEVTDDGGGGGPEGSYGGGYGAAVGLGVSLGATLGASLGRLGSSLPAGLSSSGGGRPSLGGGGGGVGTPSGGSLGSRAGASAAPLGSTAGEVFDLDDADYF